MAVTKQTYTANPTWTQSQLADLFRSAFIDAGLMTDWHDAFTVSSREVRVLRVQYDNTKTFGTSFYYFVFNASEQPAICLSSGWDTATDLPTGTQFLDFHRTPANVSNVNFNGFATSITGFNLVTTTAIFLDRFTSTTDNRQSWFVLRQGSSQSNPFSILHGSTTLHPWINLDRGIISGYSTVLARISSGAGFVDFRLQMNLRRCLLIGHALKGQPEVSFSGSGVFHAINYITDCYVGIGSVNASATGNIPGVITSSGASAVALPVGRASANPAYASDYSPICTGLPWSPFTPTALASGFGIYMHYADNTMVYGDKFIVEPGVNEWEILRNANNATVADGASASFLARVI